MVVEESRQVGDPVGRRWKNPSVHKHLLPDTNVSIAFICNSLCIADDVILDVTRCDIRLCLCAEFI